MEPGNAHQLILFRAALSSVFSAAFMGSLVHPAQGKKLVNFLKRHTIRDLEFPTSDAEFN